MKTVLTILTLVLCCFSNLSCRQNKERLIDTDKIKDTIQNKKLESIASIQVKNNVNEIKEIEKTKILVIQCSNGYGYSGMGYNFNPVIEKELQKNIQFEIIPFPYKKLIGIPYQGVYDKKYAEPLIEKVDAEIFLMTKFEKDLLLISEENKIDWGYEVKILNSKTLKQKVSIRGKGFNSYKELEKDIISKVNILAMDIESLK